MSEVRPTEDGVRWTMAVAQQEMLVQMFAQLDAAIDGPTDDPLVERLFPRVVEDDDDQDAALRMLLAGDLLLRRHEAIRHVLDRFSQAQPSGRRRVVVTLVEDEPAMVMSVLNDVRLALAARVGPLAVELRQLIEPEDVQTQQAVAAMDLLAGFQMQLLEVIDPASARHDDPDEFDDDPRP